MDADPPPPRTGACTHPLGLRAHEHSQKFYKTSSGESERNKLTAVYWTYRRQRCTSPRAPRARGRRRTCRYARRSRAGSWWRPPGLLEPCSAAFPPTALKGGQHKKSKFRHQKQHRGMSWHSSHMPKSDARQTKTVNQSHWRDSTTSPPKQHGLNINPGERVVRKWEFLGIS